MATKPETTFYRSVHRYLPSSVYQMKLHNPYLGGPPDHWYSGKSSDLWIEWKFQELPKRESTELLPDLSPLQAAWLKGRYEEGRNVAVILGCPLGGVIYTGLSWGQPLTLGEYRVRILKRNQLARWIEEIVCLGSDVSHHLR